MLTVVPQLAGAQELFGAIAYSDKAHKYSWANNFSRRDEATKAALEGCAKNGPECRVVLWFRNACGALVTGPDGYGVAWESTQTGAVNKALKLCAKRSPACAVTHSFCTGK
jgi:serine/threonine-protein kinase